MERASVSVIGLRHEIMEVQIELFLLGRTSCLPGVLSYSDFTKNEVCASGKS